MVLGDPETPGDQQRVEIRRVRLGQVEALADPGDAARLRQEVPPLPGNRLAAPVVDDVVLPVVRGEALEGRAVLTTGRAEEEFVEIPEETLAAGGV